jgi:cytochrome c6
MHSMKPCAITFALAACLMHPGAAQAGDTVRGAELYRRHCSACHGTSGRPLLPTAPDFTRPTSLLKPDLTLMDGIKRGKGAMPAYDGILREREILDVVTYLRTLK